MASSLLFRSSRRYLLRHPVLIGLSILGVALGVAVVVGIDLANSSASQAFRLSAETITGKATHAIVGSGDTVDESVYTEIRVGSGIRDAAPVVDGYARIMGEGGRTIQVLGIDPLAEGPFRSFTGGVGSDLDLGQFMSGSPTGLIATQTAQELGLLPGDEFLLQIDGIEHPITLIGLMNPSGDLSMQAVRNLLVVDISTAQDLLGLHGRLSRIDLLIPDSEQGVLLLENLRTFLPGGTEIRRPAARTETVEQMTRAFTLNLSALSLLALVVGMFLIYNTVTFSVVQRRSMIGRLRALGVTRREIFTMILSETLAIGMIGTVIGLLSGLLLGNGLVQLVSQSINDLYYVVQVRSINISMWTIVKGGVLGLGATLLATIAPAREATTAPVSTVMRRSEEESRLQSSLPGLSIAGGVFGVLAIVFLLIPGRSIVLSYIALLSVLISFSLLTPGAVTLFVVAARPVMGRLGGVVGRMAARGVLNALSRTAIAIAALMIAIAATVGVGVMVDSFRETVQTWLGYTLQADVYISPPSMVFRRNDSVIDPDVEQTLRTTSGIRGAYSVKTTQVTVSGERIDLVVIDPGPETPAAYQFKQGNPDTIWARFQENDIVLVSEPYSYRYAVDVGDTLIINTDRGVRPFAVGGVYYDYGSDLGVIMMGRMAFTNSFNDSSISGLALYAAEGQDLEKLVSNLRERVGDKQDLMIRSNRSLREASLDVFDRTFTITIVLRLLSVLVAFIGVLSALMALQLERARELAILRANGLTPKQVWRYVTMQTGLMGVIAGLFSIPLGLVLAYVLIYVINRRSFGWTLQIDVAPEILFQAVALAILAAVLAGIYPSWKMARANPTQALRDE